MLERLKQLLAEESPTAPEDGPELARIATCVLMLEVARIDEEFSDDERSRILEILQERYSLSAEDARELLEESERMRDKSVDVWQFTHQINKACSQAEKLEIVEEVWRVVVADGGIHGHESHFMRQLSRLLNLSREEVIDAKVKILEEARNSD